MLFSKKKSLETEDLKNQVEKLKQKNKELRSENNEMDEEVIILKKSLKILEIEKSTYDDRIEDEKKKVRDKEHKIELYSEELMKVEILKNSNQDLEEKLEENKDENNRLSETIDSYKREIKEMLKNPEVDQLKVDIVKLEKNLAEINKELEDERLKKLSEVAVKKNLEEENEVLRLSISNYRSRAEEVEDIKFKNNRNEKKVRLYEEELEEKVNQIGLLDKELKNLKFKNNKVEELELEKYNLKQKLEEKNTIVSKQEEELKGLQKISQEKEEVLESKNKLEKTLKQLEETLELSLLEKENDKEKIKKMEEKNRDTEVTSNLNIQLNEEVAKLTKLLSEKDTITKSLEERLIEFLNEKDSIIKELERDINVPQPLDGDRSPGVMVKKISDRLNLEDLYSEYSEEQIRLLNLNRFTSKSTWKDLSSKDIEVNESLRRLCQLNEGYKDYDGERIKSILKELEFIYARDIDTLSEVLKAIENRVLLYEREYSKSIEEKYITASKISKILGLKLEEVKKDLEEGFKQGWRIGLGYDIKAGLADFEKIRKLEIK